MNTKIKNKLNRNIKLDYLSTFIMNLNMQSSIWVLYLMHCGLNLAEIGLLEGVYHATSILCEVPSGAIADLSGRKKSMILSRICIAISCIIMLFSKSFFLFTLGFIIQALGNNFNSGSEEALVYDSMKALGLEDQYMGVYGKINVIIEVSQGIATVVGGVLSEYSYFWCYSTSVIIAILALIPVLVMTEVPFANIRKEQLSVGKAVATHFETSFLILKSNVRIMKIIVYYSVVFAAEVLLFFYSQEYYSELGYNKIQISFIMLIVGGASCLGAFVGEKSFRKMGRKVVIAATLMIAIAFVYYGLENIAISITAFVLAGFSNSVLYIVQSEELNELIPSEQRATLISVNSMFFSIAMIIMFPIAGVMADKWGLATVFSGIGLILMIFSFLWNR